MRRFTDVIHLLQSKRPDANLDIINKAYVYSAKAHLGQVRLSGEPYLTHPLEVAYNLAKYTNDFECIACGFLHDVLEDTFSTSVRKIGKIGSDLLIDLGGI